MARSYRRLAEQTEINASADVFYEPPPGPSVQQPQAQQQSQSKLEPEE